MQKKLLEDLEEIYQAAMKKKDFKSANRAKELIARYMKSRQIKSMNDLTEEEIDQIIDNYSSSSGKS